MFSNKVLATRIGRLAVIIGAVACVACADRISAPTPTVNTKSRAHLDPIEGDTLLCHSGWVIMGGRYVCNDG